MSEASYSSEYFVCHESFNTRITVQLISNDHEPQYNYPWLPSLGGSQSSML